LLVVLWAEAAFLAWFVSASPVWCELCEGGGERRGWARGVVAVSRAWATTRPGAAACS
jgi:hypothetical protein